MKTKKTARAVFLDRDGTINRMVYYPEHGIADSPFVPKQLVLLPRVHRALKLLRNKGFLLILVSNQPGLAKGYITEENFRKIDRRLDELLAKEGVVLDKKYYSFYHRDAVHKKYKKGAHLRKPKPGMLEVAAKKYGIKLKSTYFIGDDKKDILAGKKAGCKTVLVLSGKSSRESMKDWAQKPDHIFENLLEAVRSLTK